MRLKLTLPSNDGAFLAYLLWLTKMLDELELFKTAPAKVAALLVLLKGDTGNFAQYLGGCKNGDRVQSDLKNKTKKGAREKIMRIWHFLEAVADEDDLVVLRQKGVELAKPRGTSKKKPAVVTTT